MAEIVNRIAKSPLVTFKLEDYYPEGERIFLDIKDRLHMGLILREKDFRAWVKDHDWTQYEGKNVAVGCTADAIVPMWAYMLLAVKLGPHVRYLSFGSLESLEGELWAQALAAVDFASFANRPVVIKGCADRPVPERAYVEATRRMLPYAKKISYGEPCSTVPLFKR